MHYQQIGIRSLIIVNDINFRTLMSEVCCYADELFYLKVQIFNVVYYICYAVCGNHYKA